MSDIRIDFDRWKRLEQIGVCASRNRDRIILTCVNIEPGDDILSATATDSYRLATTKVETEGQAFDPFLLPAKAIKDIRLAVSKIEELGDNPDIYIKVTKREARVVALDSNETPRFSQTVRLVEGNFPHYEVIFPADDEGLEGLTKPQLVKFIAKFGELNGHSERSLKADLLHIAQQYKIGPAFAAFNAEYMRSMAESAGIKNHSHPIECRVRGPLKPIVFTSPADRNWRGLVMPVRI